MGVWRREEAAINVNVPEHMAGSASKLRLGDHTVCVTFCTPVKMTPLVLHIASYLITSL